MLPYNKKLIPLARNLRKNMTTPEILLWSRLRMKQVKGYQFYRQRPIGEYIVDFYCPQADLVIEIDGAHHFEEHGLLSDKEKNEFLKNCGLKVLRFTNNEVMSNIAEVVEQIESDLLKSP